MVKYGVVGVGYFGAELARILKRLDDAEVTVVYDPENGKRLPMSWDVTRRLRWMNWWQGRMWIRW